MEEMKNFTAPHSSTNDTRFIFWEIGVLEVCMFTFSFSFGVPTHSYILYLIVSGTGNGVTSEFFMLNLSVCGIFFSANSLLSLIVKWFTFLSLQVITHFLFGFAMTGRPLFQCLICVERYLAVLHPVTFLKYKPLRYRLICSVVVWAAVFLSCTVNAMTLLFLYTELYCVFLLAQFVLYFSITLFCCLAVLRALKQSRPGERKKDEENHVKRRAFHLISITAASMTITYVPFTITVFLFFLQHINIQILWSISYVCFMLTGLVLPVMFLYRTGKLECIC